jgi:hypothetical protein
VRWILLLPFALTLLACTTEEVRYAHNVPLQAVQAPYAESDLLDVGVIIFNSGVPDGEIDRATLEQLMRDGTFVQIRRTEAMFLAVKLKDTLQNSGHWGSVYVTPANSTALDLNVTAEILRSDGNVFELRARATDATGRLWLNKKYTMATAASAFNRQRYPTLDPYQDVFNEIANDLASLRGSLSEDDVADIRSIAELRYASQLSPEAFEGYLEEDNNGRYEPVRLPAVDDPMLLRTRSVRQREQLVFETLDQYYENFTSDATNSYDSWRESSREDSIQMEEAARAAKLRTGLGALSIALSIAYGADSDNNSFADAVLQNAGFYIAGDLLRSAAVRRQERRLHTQALQELSESFDDSVKPLVVEVQGAQHRLTGTAAAQYAEWQDLLRELFLNETGVVPDEIDVYVEPDPAEDGGSTPDAAANPEAGSESEDATPDESGATPADV